MPFQDGVRETFGTAAVVEARRRGPDMNIHARSKQISVKGQRVGRPAEVHMWVNEEGIRGQTRKQLGPGTTLPAVLSAPGLCAN